MSAFTIIEAEQRSEAWLAARVGRLTGTCAADMLATIKSGEAAARRDLRARLVCERLTGVSQEDHYINAAMQRGIDKEADAFAAYEALSGNLVRRTGFIAHSEILAGCSLDGDVDEFAGIVEIKVPKTATHLAYLKAGAVPSNHLPQILHNLWITGAGWCDFVSFDDRLPDALQLFVCRIEREPITLNAYETQVRAFLAEVDAEVEHWMKRMGVAA